MFTDQFEGEVSAIAFGGNGIVKHEGLVIFCPFTLPGERIKGQIIKKKKNYAEAALIEIKTPSPQRIKPRCPHFGVCGGCQLQHVEMETQLEIKRQWVVDALQRIANLREVRVEPVIASKTPYSYRRHISMALLPSSNGYRAVYTGHNPRDSVETTVCPIFIEESCPVLSQLQQTVQQLTCAGPAEGRVIVMKQTDGRFFFKFHFKKLPANTIEIFKNALKSFKKWSGALCQAPGKSMQWGESIAHMSIGSYAIAYSSSVFVQNHPEQSVAIYNAVAAIAQESHPKKALDLYCGIGTTSILLSPYCQTITGVELNPDGVRLARQNCSSNKVTNVDIREGDVEKELDILSKDKYDWVLLNPPRTGAGDQVMRCLLEMLPQHIVYVSCMPPTLARDIKPLLQNGYKIVHCQPYDMFPQTAHVETLLHLTRNVI